MNHRHIIGYGAEHPGPLAIVLSKEDIQGGCRGVARQCIIARAIRRIPMFKIVDSVMGRILLKILLEDGREIHYKTPRGLWSKLRAWDHGEAWPDPAGTVYVFDMPNPLPSEEKRQKQKDYDAKCDPHCGKHLRYTQRKLEI